MALLVARAAAVPVLAVGVGLARTPRPAGRDVGLIALVGLVDLAATACFGLATTKGALAVVAVLGAMYPVVTATLARVICALFGVVLVAAG